MTLSTPMILGIVIAMLILNNVIYKMFIDVKGSQGPQGEQGPRGPRGLEGPAGGPPGPAGPAGPAGPKGEQGAYGLVSSSPLANDPSVCKYGGVKLTFGVDSDKDGKISGNEVKSSQNICKGDKGDKGAASTVAGPRGAVGPAGARGAAGPAGPAGPRGPNGGLCNGSNCLTPAEFNKLKALASKAVDVDATGNVTFKKIVTIKSDLNQVIGGNTKAQIHDGRILGNYAIFGPTTGSSQNTQITINSNGNIDTRGHVKTRHVQVGTYATNGAYTRKAWMDPDGTIRNIGGFSAGSTGAINAGHITTLGGGNITASGFVRAQDLFSRNRLNAKEINQVKADGTAGATIYADGKFKAANFGKGNVPYRAVSLAEVGGVDDCGAILSSSLTKALFAGKPVGYRIYYNSPSRTFKFPLAVEKYSATGLRVMLAPGDGGNTTNDYKVHSGSPACIKANALS